MQHLNELANFLEQVSNMATKYNPALELLGYLISSIVGLCTVTWAVVRFILKPLKNRPREIEPQINAQPPQPATPPVIGPTRSPFMHAPTSFEASIKSWGGTPGKLKTKLELTNTGSGGNAYNATVTIPKLNYEKNLNDLPRNRSKSFDIETPSLPSEIIMTIYYTNLDGVKLRHDLEMTGITPHNATTILSFPTIAKVNT